MTIRNKIQKLEELAHEANTTLKELFIINVEGRSQRMREAFENGTFQKVLVGGVMLGTEMTLTGYVFNNDFVQGIGYGVLAMDGIYTAILYRKPILQRIKEFYHSKKTEA